MALAPMALMPGRATGAGEGVTFIAVALAVAAAIAVVIAIAIRVGDWSREKSRPALRAKLVHLALLLVSGAGVALAVATKARGS